MLDASIFALTAIGAVSTLLYGKSTKNNMTKENFGGLHYPMKWKVAREAAVQNQRGCETHVAAARNYQSSLAPRTSGQGYGGAISGSYPSYENQAIPRTPIGGDPRIQHVTPRQYNPISMNNDYGGTLTHRTGIQPNPSGTQITNTLPVTDMRDIQCTSAMQPVSVENAISRSVQRSGAACSRSSGDVVNPIVYDRLIYAGGRSKLRAQGDPIRGDIAIAPVLPTVGDSNSMVMFRPSVDPQLDLQEGALNVMGGNYNATNNNLRSLMSAASGGTMQTFGGESVPNARMVGCNGVQDIQVRSFV